MSIVSCCTDGWSARSMLTSFACSFAGVALDMGIATEAVGELPGHRRDENASMPLGPNGGAAGIEDMVLGPITVAGTSISSRDEALKSLWPREEGLSRRVRPVGQTRARSSLCQRDVQG